MTYLLDTSICIYFLNASHPRVVERILASGPDRLAISSLTLAELLLGAAQSSRPEANRTRLASLAAEIGTVSFDDSCAEHFGRIKAALLAAGQPIPDFDTAIAATAFACGATLVSSDRHMTAIAGLPLENWAAAGPADRAG